MTSTSNRGAQVSTPLRIELKRDVQAPGLARGAVSEWSLGADVSRAQLQTLVLLVSEVVSNAVLHSKAAPGATITLTARLDGETVRITVSDAGEGFTPRERDPEHIGDGYGLFLLDKIASRWGVDRAGPTSVWFELPRSG